MTRDITSEEHQFFINMGVLLHTSRIKNALSQTDMGNILGCTFQQVQKYEKGMNRISLYRLLQWATIVRLPLTYFFFEKPMASDIKEISKQTLRYMKTFNRLSITQQRAVIYLIESML